MAKKYTKPADKSTGAVGGISIKFDDHADVIQGYVEIHWETADGEAFGQPTVRGFSELTAAQQAAIRSFLAGLRTKVSTDASVLERNTKESES